MYCYQIFFVKKSKGAFLYSNINIFSKEWISLRVAFAFLPTLLNFIALIFVIISLARLQAIEDRVNHTQKGVDIMIVMDISLSMLIEDMGSRRTRLESSREVVGEFIDGRPNDRIGLIAFSGESFTKVPLTFDHELLKSSLKQVNILPSIKAGTAIGVALANAVVRLKHSPLESRMIIFLTDGDNNRGFIDPETALQIVRKNKIKVYTIGLGSKNGTFPITYKIQNAMGRSSYKRVYVNSRINTELMKKISFQTGGEFFMAYSLLSLKRVFKKIDALEKYEIQTNKWTQYEEYFESFLLIGTVLYFLSVFLSLTVFFKGI